MHKNFELSSDNAYSQVGVVFPQEHFAGAWVNTHIDKKAMITTTDYPFNGNKAISQALLNQSRVDGSSFTSHLPAEGYLWLGYNNVVNEKVFLFYESTPLTDYQGAYFRKNEIFNNGGSEIWR